MYKLRDYQEDMVRIGVHNLKNSDKPFILQAATGAGKSLVIAAICHTLDEPVLVLQPSKELLEQNYAKLKSYGVEDVAIYSASVGQKEIAKYTYATIGSIRKKPEEFAHFKYVILDECFVAGTKIDGRNIEDVKQGDVVLAFDHKHNMCKWAKVKNVSKKPLPSRLYRVTLNGEYIISTGNHPYYVVNKGYIAAKDLLPGDKVYAIKKQPHREHPLHILQRISSGEELPPVLAVQDDGGNLPQRMLDNDESRDVVLADEAKQSDAGRNHSQENVGNPEKDWSQTTYPRWQWKRIELAAEDTMGLTGRRLVYGASGEDLSETTYVSAPLQDRPSQPDKDARCRAGREQPLLTETTGQEEDRTVTAVRVDCVEVQEQRSDVRPSGNSHENFVYNLEVEGYHNYFANGILVHNCHMLNPKNGEGMLTKFLKDIGCTKVCGLTATPYRNVQKYFYEGNNMYYTAHLKMVNRIHPFFFKSVKYKIETQDLIDMGYLSPILYRADKEVNMLDLKINSTGADFDLESVEQFWSDKRIEKMAHIIQKIDEKCQRNLIFCSSLRQANTAHRMLSEMGIASEIVDGKTPAKERTKLVEGFKAGTFKHMINVGVFTTGFDVPELDCIVIARPTMSLALYYQMVGRGVRLDPARPDKKLRVYDLAGVVEKLGRVETIRIVTEEGGFRDEVWSEVGRMDEVPLFKFLVKNQPKFSRGK